MLFYLVFIYGKIDKYFWGALIALYSLHSYPSLYPAESYPELPASLPVVICIQTLLLRPKFQTVNCIQLPWQARVLCLVFYTTLEGREGR